MTEINNQLRNKVHIGLSSELDDELYELDDELYNELWDELCTELWRELNVELRLQLVNYTKND